MVQWSQKAACGSRRDRLLPEEGKAMILRGKKLTVVSTLHYIRILYRSILFILLLIGYVSYRLNMGDPITETLEKRPLIIVVTWLVFMIEMVFRFFPSRYESPGCQKQFAKNYIKSGNTQVVVQDNNAVIVILLVWIVLNAAFGALHMRGILDDGIMILLCSAYSVCDMICILFFCPFQSWLMKNKCCSTCRIYNWAQTQVPLLIDDAQHRIDVGVVQHEKAPGVGNGVPASPSRR